MLPARPASPAETFIHTATASPSAAGTSRCQRRSRHAPNSSAGIAVQRIAAAKPALPAVARYSPEYALPAS